MSGMNKTSQKVMKVANLIRTTKDVLAQMEECVRFISDEIEKSESGKIDTDVAEVVSHINMIMQNIDERIRSLPENYFKLIQEKLLESTKLKTDRNAIVDSVKKSIKNYAN